VTATKEDFTTRDERTGRLYACRWGLCPACEQETLLFVHAGKKYWRCGNCMEPDMKAYQ
jgi:ribosomal protein S27E